MSISVYHSSDGIIFEEYGRRLHFSCARGKLADNYEPGEHVLANAEECGTIQLVLGRLNIDGQNVVLVVTEVSTICHFCTPSQNEIPIYRIDRAKAIPITATASQVKEILVSASDGARKKLKFGADKLFSLVNDKPVVSTRLEDVLRLFNDIPDFYFCKERDLTLCTQRYFTSAGTDERFFWNKYLMKDLLAPEGCPLSKWIVPVIHGFVASAEYRVGDEPAEQAVLRFTIISRRSVHRAGVRYLRRGIDSESNVANFVETELLLNILDHHLSFVQIRGSIPVFWSQRGMKYRPPLTIERPIEECLPYCEAHFDKLLSHYGEPLAVINLVDLTGREMKLAQCYLEHVLKLNQPKMTFVSYDLHHHCRGMRFENVSTLVDTLGDILNEIGFCWVDRSGEAVRHQKGVIRTNCIDCLDRTNVVQSAISMAVCVKQAQRLGVFGPLNEPPDELITFMQTLWADNGDALSTQYAGTAALKGDVTRNGERRLAGIMKDGYNSASRYYLSHAKDSSRQKAINLLLGQPDIGTESMVESDSDSEEDESVRRLVNEAIHFLLPEGEIVIGGWALTSTECNDDRVDTVLLLTRTRLYIAVYEVDEDKMSELHMIDLNDIDSIEVGPTLRNSPHFVKVACEQGVWAWKAAKTRLFNNVAIRMKNKAEANEYVESIAEQMQVAIAMQTGRELVVEHPQRVNIARQSVSSKVFSSMSAAFKRFQAEGSTTKIATPSTASTIAKAKDDIEVVAVTDADSLKIESNVRPSASDSQLSEQGGLVSQLRRIRVPFSRESNRQEQLPFQHLEALIKSSTTKTIFL